MRVCVCCGDVNEEGKKSLCMYVCVVDICCVRTCIDQRKHCWALWQVYVCVVAGSERASCGCGCIDCVVVRSVLIVVG